MDAVETLALLRRHGFGAHSTLVDLGAGTGAFGVAAARVCKKVVAVDVSPAMIAAIRANATAHRCANLEAVQAGFLSYVHVGEPVDVVHSRHALHHLPDLWKAVALLRAARLLDRVSSTCRDLVFSFELDESDTALGMARWRGGLLGGRLDARRVGDAPARRVQHVHLAPRADAERAGLAILEARHSNDGIYAEYVCEARQLAPA